MCVWLRSYEQVPVHVCAQARGWRCSPLLGHSLPLFSEEKSLAELKVHQLSEAGCPSEIHLVLAVGLFGFCFLQIVIWESPGKRKP